MTYITSCEPATDHDFFFLGGMAHMLRFAWLVLCLFLISNSAGAAQPSAVKMDRPSFAKLAMERTQREFFGTDAGGIWLNTYRLLIPARALDRALYERMLEKIATERDDLNCGTVRFDRLNCALRNVVEIAIEVGALSEAMVFSQDAADFAEKTLDKDPQRYIDSQLRLAMVYWQYGSLSEAEATTAKASAQLQKFPRLLTNIRKFRLAIMLARIADANLRDEEVVPALSHMADAVIALGHELQDRDQEALEEIVSSHARGLFCPGCGKPIAEPIQRILQVRLNKLATSTGPIGLDSFLDIVGLVPRETFSPVDLQRISKRALEGIGSGSLQTTQSTAKLKNELRSISALARIEGKNDDFSSALILARSRMLTWDGSLDGIWTTYFEKPTIANEMAVLKDMKEAESSAYGQFGAVTKYSALLDTASIHFQRSGFDEASRIVLGRLTKEVVGQIKTQGREVVVNPQTVAMARIYVPALSRLAAMKLAKGQKAEALRLLGQARAIAQAKLRAASLLGGGAKLLAYRDMSAPLQSIAQTYVAAAASDAKPLAAGSSLANETFQALRASLEGEVALTAEIANRRRVLSTPKLTALDRELAASRAEAERLSAFVEHYSNINIASIGTRIVSLDIDGALSTAAESARQRVNRLSTELEQLAGNFATDPTGEATLASVLKSLKSGEALLMLQSGRDSMQGFLADSGGRVTVWRTPSKKETLVALDTSLRAGGDSSGGSFSLEASAKTFEAIFGPVSKVLSSHRKLLILGDGPLQALPYGLLLTSRPKTPKLEAEEFRAAKLPWLIRQHSIALIPSVQTMIAQRANSVPSKATKPFIGIGNPKLGPVQTAQRAISTDEIFAQKSAGLADLRVLRRVPSLPETEDELREIAHALGAGNDALVVGADANEPNVRGLDLSQYKVVAFATHGAFAGEHSVHSEPGLVLTPPEEASPANDGFLALSEILILKLDADLVVLSACNTGAPDGRPRSERLSGLARGFFAAGARGLLVTHWHIPSNSAVKTTTGTIKAKMGDPGQDWADALRQATLSIIDHEGPATWAHPSFWAGFAAVGVQP